MKLVRKPIPPREFQICERLRAIREGDRWTQGEFAAQLAINRERLASYEAGRVPMRYDLALRVCRQFIISEKWLATGKGDKSKLMDLATDHVVTQIPPDAPFGEAYDKFLAPVYEFLFKQRAGRVHLNIQGGESPQFLLNLFMRVLASWLTNVEPAKQPQFLTRLIEFGTEVVAYYQRHGDIPRFLCDDSEAKERKNRRPVQKAREDEQFVAAAKKRS